MPFEAVISAIDHMKNNPEYLGHSTSEILEEIVKKAADTFGVSNQSTNIGKISKVDFFLFGIIHMNLGIAMLKNGIKVLKFLVSFP